MHNGTKRLREFEGFRVDLSKKLLWYADALVPLPAKAVEVLCELVERPGEVVTKHELLDRVWRNSFVEESVLAQNVHHLRKTFKDLNIGQDPIQTIPRRGYRFAGDVHDVEEEDVVIEHEIVERKLVTEISEDSLRDLGLTKERSSSARLTRRTFSLLLPVILLALIFVGIAIWEFGTSAESSAANNIRSIVVLPLRNLGDQKRGQTFSLGLTDALITRLGRLNKFAVRPFTAIEKYDQSGKDAIEYGKELKADAVLEGTIQSSDNRIRINLRLINVRTGNHIWSDDFEEVGADALKLQDIISSRVARALFSKLNIRDEATLAKAPTTNSEAYDLYLSGRDRWLRRDWTADCLSFYQKAIELDPNFALAYVGIADHYAFSYEIKTAEETLSKAIEIDPDLAEAYATRGFLQMFHHWDWKAAEASLRRAIELEPNSFKAHHWYGVYLSIRGRQDEALAEMQKALELDPTALVVMTDIAEVYYFKHDYDRAEADLNKVIEIDPNFRNARQHLIKVRYKKGGSYFLEEAAFNVYLQHQLRSKGLDYTYQTDDLETMIARRDETALQKHALESYLASMKAKPEGALGLSRFYALTGDNEKCLAALEKAYLAKAFVIPFVAVDPLWDPVRNDPRFQEIIRKMNL
jgi:TolB-like protein/DNA-binding winged helix-turn-helix (wHTH) protein/Tfp pilus assembly protein PilF